MGAQAVSWLTVHQYVVDRLRCAGVDSWPTAGTPEWAALPDADPRKLAAVLDAGQHHALRVETAQEALAAASRDIAASADWTAVSSEITARKSFFAERPWLRRQAGAEPSAQAMLRQVSGDPHERGVQRENA